MYFYKKKNNYIKIALANNNIPKSKREQYIMYMATDQKTQHDYNSELLYCTLMNIWYLLLQSHLFAFCYYLHLSLFDCVGTIYLALEKHC